MLQKGLREGFLAFVAICAGLLLGVLGVNIAVALFPSERDPARLLPILGVSFIGTLFYTYWAWRASKKREGTLPYAVVVLIAFSWTACSQLGCHYLALTSYQSALERIPPRC